MRTFCCPSPRTSLQARRDRNDLLKRNRGTQPRIRAISGHIRSQPGQLRHPSSRVRAKRQLACKAPADAPPLPQTVYKSAVRQESFRIQLGDTDNYLIDACDGSPIAVGNRPSLWLSPRKPAIEPLNRPTRIRCAVRADGSHAEDVDIRPVRFRPAAGVRRGNEFARGGVTDDSWLPIIGKFIRAALRKIRANPHRAGQLPWRHAFASRGIPHPRLVVHVPRHQLPASDIARLRTLSVCPRSTSRCGNSRGNV